MKSFNDYIYRITLFRDFRGFLYLITKHTKSTKGEENSAIRKYRDISFLRLIERNFSKFFIALGISKPRIV